MPTSLKQLEEQALALTAEERAKLVETLLEALHSPIFDTEKAWAEVIAQRIEAFDRGEISTYSAEDVFAHARRLSLGA